MYYIQLLDKDGCEMAAHYDVDSLTDARSMALDYLADDEYRNDAYKVEVRNSGNDECVYDRFFVA